jgi:hypothetical protein
LISCTFPSLLFVGFGYKRLLEVSIIKIGCAKLLQNLEFFFRKSPRCVSSRCTLVDTRQNDHGGTLSIHAITPVDKCLPLQKGRLINKCCEVHALCHPDAYQSNGETDTDRGFLWCGTEVFLRHPTAWLNSKQCLAFHGVRERA